MSKILLGIQARSTSTRLPKKVLEKIGHKSMLNHVIDLCKNSSRYCNYNLKRYNVETEVAVLAPFNDPVITHVGGRCKVYTGPEEDVLERYYQGVYLGDYSYVVRITSDCAILPSWLISKAISLAMVGGYHYLSNTAPKYRTFLDGWDVEVISKDLLFWLRENVKDPSHREHVTSYVHSNTLPAWATKGHIIGSLDLSDLKLSVDTLEDLERVRDHYDRIKSKQAAAFFEFGRENTHVV